MIIIYRACEANLSAQSLGDSSSSKPRWSGKYKAEIFRKCFKSLQANITSDDTIIIAADSVSIDTLNWMRDNTRARFVVKNITPIREIKHPYPEFFDAGVNCCIELFELLLTTAENNPDDFIYLCEDDYLHLPVAIEAMKNLYSQGYKGFYVPYDYPDRYTIDNNKEAIVTMSYYGHLRSIPSATLTVAANSSIWLKYKFELLRNSVFSEDSWTWKAFKQNHAFCPIPGHATHLQNNCISPMVDWLAYYESIDI